jgi:RNA polymerase sigma factor (sigma-70 family)
MALKQPDMRQTLSKCLSVFYHSHNGHRDKSRKEEDNMPKNEKHLWPGCDDREVVEEMLRNPASYHWGECRKSVMMIVQQVPTIPLDYQEDIAQEILIRVARSLHGFRYQGRFTTWLTKIAQSCITDFYRKYRRELKNTALSEDLQDNYENGHGVPDIPSNRNTEVECIIREKLQRIPHLINDYVSIYPHKERNRQIIWMVLLADRPLEEVAHAAGCSVKVVRFIVHTAQHFIREKLDLPQQSRSEKKNLPASRYNAILQHERKRRGWSQQDLAEQLLALGAEDGRRPTLNVKSIGRWERGESKPIPYYRNLLCQLYQRSEAELGFVEEKAAEVSPGPVFLLPETSPANR